MIDISTLVGLVVLGIYIYYFVFFRFGYVKCDSNVCLNGKTALVTGGSRGLGYEIALSLASRGCRVIILDKVVNEDIKKTIIEETDNPNIILEYVDFASFRSIRQYAKKFNDSEEKLDILINNVGIPKSPECLTEDGLNITMQVTYFGSFLLTHLLINSLKKSKNGRVVFTTSVASFLHFMSPDSITDTYFKKGLPKWLSFYNYANAKFATVVASDIFAEKLKKWNITCNVYHPGIASTNIWNDARKQVNWYIISDVVTYIILLLISVSYGIHPKLACQPALHLAVSKECKNLTGTFYGKYFPNVRPRGNSDIKFCNAIWRNSEKIVELQPNEILK